MSLPTGACKAQEPLKVEHFTDYMSAYRGTALCDVSTTDWLFFSSKAIEKLEHYKRIYTVTAPDEKAEKMAVCAMADALYFFANAQNGGSAVTSASVGSVSVSYASQSGVDLSPKAQEQELFRCASQYLDIYRGVG